MSDSNSTDAETATETREQIHSGVSITGEVKRGEDARAQESYFAVALTVGVLGGLGVGTVVEAAAMAAGVEIPVKTLL